VAEPGPTRAARPWRRIADATARVLAALAGTLPVSVLGAICAGRLAPLSDEARVALAVALAIPLWVLAACALALARSGVRAWLWCGGLSLALGGLALGTPL
jgi:hypothetical protein